MSNVGKQGKSSPAAWPHPEVLALVSSWYSLSWTEQCLQKRSKYCQIHGTGFELHTDYQSLHHILHVAPCKQNCCQNFELAAFILRAQLQMKPWSRSQQVPLTFYSLLVTWCTSSLTFNSCMLCPHCICVFCIYLRTNSDLCHFQHKLIGFYNRDEKCLQRGTDLVFK